MSNNPFLQEDRTGRLPTGLDEEEINEIFRPNNTPPTIQIESPAEDTASASSSNPPLPLRPVSPSLPPRPVSPSLPERPVSPSLPPRPDQLDASNSLSVTDQVPSPAYTPVASPNEVMLLQQDNSPVPPLDLDTEELPPSYSELISEDQPIAEHQRPTQQPSGYQRPPGPPSGYQRPPGPPSEYQRPSHPPSGYLRPAQPPPQRHRPSGSSPNHRRPAGPPPRPNSSLFPGRLNVTYGAAAYNSNQPPLPPRRDW